ncbi:hypothetical protein VPH35_139575 [Triticum aestivum]
MEGGVISVPAPAPVCCLANREFQATPTPSPPDESTVLRELNVSVSLSGLDISRGHHGEPDVLGQRRSKYKPMVRTVSKMHMAAKARAEKVAAAKAAADKAKAEKKAAADKAKAEKKKADDKAKAEKAAAPPASPEWLRLYLDEGYGIKKQVTWLLEWDKKPRDPLPNFPEELREAMDAIKAERDENERVLVDFKRDGYAYVQVDVFNDDNPRANLPADQYEVIPHDSDEEA